MKLTPHEEKILELVHRHPEIVEDANARKKIAADQGLSEKTLRNRIADLKKYGALAVNQKINPKLDSSTSIDDPFTQNTIEFWRKRKFIFWNTVIVGIVSIIVSLLLPKWYSSKAVVISSGGGSANFLSMLSGIPMGDFGLSNINEDISNYIAILESRGVREKIVNEYNLVKRYDVKDLEYAIDALAGNVELKVSNEGALSITTLDKDPVIARDLALSFLSKLDSVNRKLAMEKGFFNRQFFEQRLSQNRKDLTAAEDELKAFQQLYGIIDIPGQLTAVIEGYAQVYAEKIRKEAELKVAQTTFSNKDPKVMELKALVKELDNRLSEMNFKGDDQKVLLAFKEMPELGLQYARIFREVKIQEKILEYLTPQYEQARMEETKNIPSLQILDSPQIAIHKTKPKRMLIVIGATLFGLIINIIYVYTVFHTKNLRGLLKQSS